MHLKLQKAANLQAGNIAYLAPRGGGSIKVAVRKVDPGATFIEVLGEVLHVSDQLGKSERDLLGKAVSVVIDADLSQCVIEEVPA